MIQRFTPEEEIFKIAQYYEQEKKLRLDLDEENQRLRKELETTRKRMEAAQDAFLEQHEESSRLREQCDELRAALRVARDEYLWVCKQYAPAGGRMVVDRIEAALGSRGSRVRKLVEAIQSVLQYCDEKECLLPEHVTLREALKEWHS